MNADLVIKKMNQEMYNKKSDVRFTWSSTENNDTNANGYFLLWGYRQSAFQHGNSSPMNATFLFKGMGSMLDDVIQRDGELNKFEKFVIDTFPSEK